MTRRIEVDGTVHEFPDDATDAEISRALAQAERAPQPRRPSEAQARDVARYSAQRYMQRNTPGAFGWITQPIVNMISDPARRAELARSARGAWRDVQQIPSLNAGQLVQDTLRAGGEAVQNLPQTLGAIAQNLPQIARGATYGPFVDEEQAQRRLDLARILGDAEGEQQAAREANAATAGIALNTVGAVGAPLASTPLRAAGFAAALDAPFALSRGDPNAPLQERLPEALTEIGGAATFAGGAQYLANSTARALSAPPRSGRMVERMDRAGVTPSLAAAQGGGITGTATKAIGDNILAGPMVRQRVQTQLTQARDAAQRVAEGYGHPRSLEGAGGVIQRGVERFANDRSLPNPHPGIDPERVSTRGWSFAAKADAVYDHALEPVLDRAAPLTRTIATLDEVARRSDSPAVRQFQADPVLTRFERLARRLQRGASDSFEPAAADDVVAMAAEIETARRAAGQRQHGLATWTRRQGGVRDDRGDIRGMDPGGRGASAMLSRNGRTIDDLAVAAWEDGYFPGAEPPTARQFLEALDRDLRAPGSVAPADVDTFAASNAREILNHYEAQGIDTSRRGQALQRDLQRLVGVDEGTGGRPPTLRDLRELRRKVREAQTRSQALGQSVDNAALQRLEAALTEDIYSAAGDLAGDLQSADRWYRRGRQRIDDVLNEFARGDPGQALPRILRMAKPGGDTRGLAALRGALLDDEWRTVAASLVDHMGQPTPGASGFTAQLGFSVQNFATAYRRMTPAARRIVFGSRGGQGGPSGIRMRQLAEELDNLAEVALHLKGVEGMANFSGTASHLQTGATVSGVALNLPMTLTVVAGLGLVGEVLTNPAAVRWLTSAPRGRVNAQGMRRWLRDLGRIAARDPALIPVYNELVELQAPESARPADAARDRQRQLQPAP